MKILVVVDMQNDFISGALGSPEAEAIVPGVREKIEKYRGDGGTVVFTRDTHGMDYLETQEGRLLPVQHCIWDTDGWQISTELETEGCRIIDKPSFGSAELPEYVKNLIVGSGSAANDCEIQLIGICTDICVLSNAILLKAALPETPIVVDGARCAGVNPESHRRALAAMEMCQIRILD